MSAMQRWIHTPPLRRLRTLVAVTWLLASPPAGAQVLHDVDPFSSSGSPGAVFAFSPDSRPIGSACFDGRIELNQRGAR